MRVTAAGSLRNVRLWESVSHFFILLNCDVNLEELYPFRKDLVLHLTDNGRVKNHTVEVIT
jgi:hypothetical protein